MGQADSVLEVRSESIWQDGLARCQSRAEVRGDICVGGDHYIWGGLIKYVNILWTVGARFLTIEERIYTL